MPRRTAGEKSGDTRKSIAERYAGHDDYLSRFTKATDELVKQRWILPEDREALIHRGEQEWDERGPVLPGETKTNRMDREPRDSLLTR